jgi:hypothetical protein
MRAPTKELLRLVGDGKIRHGNNPVLRWNIDNFVTRSDPAGNVKPDKALSLDTPLPTPYGWKLMGDMTVGDVLFDEEGNQCTVTGVSDIAYGHDCLRVHFDIGEPIVADAEHEWVVYDVKAYGEKKAQLSVKTTRELSEDVVRIGEHKQYRYSVPVAGSLQTKEQDFILDPYVLGCWLGDGSTSSCYITSEDKEIFEHFGALKATHANCCPCANKSCLYHVEGLNPSLHEMQIWNRKRIPDGYLRGSAEQRLALLQGLMDTDGHIAAEGGFSCFVNTNKNIVDGIYELLTSLGYKASIKSGIARCKEKSYGPMWKVTFTARKDTPPFRLTRKAERIPDAPTRRARGLTRQITGIENVTSVPVRCVQVASPSHLYLAGSAMIPTHNSKATQKIDGVVAMIMALDRAIRNKGNGRSIYEDRGFELAGVN